MGHPCGRIPVTRYPQFRGQMRIALRITPQGNFRRAGRLVRERSRESPFRPSPFARARIARDRNAPGQPSEAAAVSGWRAATAFGGAARRHSRIISTMVLWHPPQTPPAPHAAVTSRRFRAPVSMALRTCFSETPWHRQTTMVWIMPILKVIIKSFLA